MRTLLHNIVAHPIAGVLWWLGFDRRGDRVHEWWASAMEPKPSSPEGETDNGT